MDSVSEPSHIFERQTPLTTRFWSYPWRYPIDHANSGEAWTTALRPDAGTVDVAADPGERSSAGESSLLVLIFLVGTTDFDDE